MGKPEIAIVWFKRDLRIHDHAPLSEAAHNGAVLPIYIAEPELWRQPDSSRRHWNFIRQSLVELNNELAGLGQPLLLMTGDAVSVFDQLRQRFAISAIHSHQETGNLWSYARDTAVLAWCREHRIAWHEYQSGGVIRRLKHRDGWARRWNEAMAQPLVSAPISLRRLEPALPPFQLPELGLPPLESGEEAHLQPGGRSHGIELLRSFVDRRGHHYSKSMSSPVTGEWGCSRLSPHLAYGTLSLREVHQRVREQRERSDLAPGWKASLAAFDKRLHWHCHFIQKLESDPEFETRNMLPVFDGLREADFDPERFQAWRDGRTGYPFVDACMRSLRATGWLNFRMRAMLVAFSSYQLWLHWREPALHLACCFTDYEPGIHYPQVQMQSGTTGINTLRMYNPVKQSRDQDPDGVFIRRWCPELARLPDAYLHEPWTLPREFRRTTGFSPGEDYPLPIVDHLTSVRLARARFAEWRKQHPEFFEQARAMTEKHGSRRRPTRGRRVKSQAHENLQPDLLDAADRS